MRRSARHLTFRRRRRRRLARTIVVVALLGGAAGWFLWLRPSSDPTPPGEKAVAACDISPDILQRVWRGYVPHRSGEVLAIERLPNQWGSRHSTPYGYTQNVPLVLYGPGYVRAGSYDRPVTLADVAPTYARLLGFDSFPARDGAPLHEALLPEADRNGLPRLIFTLVWDGGGWNGLRRWPDAWPHLANLMKRSATFEHATVGSSPSITPAVHATIGTGDFPKRHGISDVRMRVGGQMVDAEQGDSPRYLRVKTIGDLWDAANGNLPKVGLFARDAWHLGMLGHGAATPGADHDLAVLDNLGGVDFHTNERYYYIPSYMTGTPGLADIARKVDLRDGEADQSWLGNPIVPFDGRIRYTPAWDIYQTQRLKELIENEGYGTDTMPDLFFTNYKSVDLAGHEWGMTQQEVRDDLAEQDAQLPKILAELDRVVGRNNYVLLLTADHGMQPYPDVTGGWSINTEEMTSDIERKFDHKTPNVPIMLSNRGYQYVMNAKEMKRNHVTPDDVTAFIRSYRLGDNVPNGSTVPGAFRDKTDERLFLTALTPPELKKALDCARGKTVSQRGAERRSFATRARNIGFPSR